MYPAPQGILDKTLEEVKEEKLTGGPQPPSQGCGGGLPEALCRTDLLILLQKFARYYLTKKPQAPVQELETKAELLRAGKSQDTAGDYGRDTGSSGTLLGSIPSVLPGTHPFEPCT